MSVDTGLIAHTTGGKWLTAPLSSPLEVQPGDTIEVEHNLAWLKRDGQFIASRTIGPATELVLTAFAEPHQLTHVTYYEKKPMPATTATIVGVTVNQSTGTVRVNFSNSNQREFASFADLVAAADAFDADTEMAENLAIMVLARRTPDGSNLDVCNGMGVTIDGAANQPIAFSGMPQQI